jgi:hypothetical protein
MLPVRRRNTSEQRVYCDLASNREIINADLLAFIKGWRVDSTNRATGDQTGGAVENGTQCF